MVVKIKKPSTRGLLGSGVFSCILPTSTKDKTFFIKSQGD
ncbi:MAG: hypothetical protein BWX91_01061 [Spirochaetes bacterium ADurb.Bin133]|nr:MAG: hypothetical protein BWX91_01061 [Spirochaetes bacterium ADurb.Bin133]